MKIWFDADNAPHVPVMKPLAEELSRRGHEVRFTARDRASTCELLDLYGFEYVRVGGPSGRSKVRKALGTLGRALLLRRAMRHWKADVSFGHGSRSLPLASGMLGIPSVTMYDYEWVNPTIFNRFCTRILLPEAISVERCIEAGIDANKVVFFPGYKEELYLGGIEADPSIRLELGLRPDMTKVLLRPPATTAHYHNPRSEEILKALLDRLLSDRAVQIVWIPRTSDQMSMVQGGHQAVVVVPRRVYPGPELILEMDMVIGGGGTMTREAAVLGVPSYSFFMGRPGMVDADLQSKGRLCILDDVSMLGGCKGASATRPDGSVLLETILETVTGSGRMRG